MLGELLSGGGNIKKMLLKIRNGRRTERSFLRKTVMAGGGLNQKEVNRDLC